MRYFTLPMDVHLLKINYLFGCLEKNHHEIFIDNTNIQSFFGCPPNCIWNGGGVSNNFPMPNKEIKYICNKFNNLNKSLRLTFTNKLLEEKHLYDTYGNAIANIFNNNFINEVLVSTDIMENYIKSNYPNLKVVQSITRCWYDLDIINEKSKDQIVVLPIRYNNDFESLKKLKYPENIEILLNEQCIENCPYNESHYMSFNKYTLREVDTYFKCPFEDKKGSDKKHYIFEQDIKKYEDFGFSLFKLSGRGLNESNILNMYIDYLIKDEYKYSTFTNLLHDLQNYDFWCDFK